jgi:signal transduction histidine kinase
MPIEARSTALNLEQELGEFSYIVSHDMSVPIRHLAQFSRLFLDEAGANLTESQKAFADQIHHAGDRCQMMIEQLLVYSRIQQRPLVQAHHDARRLVETAVLQLSQAVGAARAEVEIGPLGVIDGDGDLLTLAFRNLLDNAIKFRKPQGPCAVAVRVVPERGRMALEFRDNGIGLPEESFARAFRMFCQLQPEGEYPGIGAGLTICRRIARRHGGEVYFVPAQEGACVRFVLPVE